MTTALTIPPPRLPAKLEISAEWLAERDQLASEAAALQTIGNQGQFNAAELLLRRITSKSNEAEAVRKSLSDPFNRAAKDIKAMADGAREPLEAAKDKLKATMGGYIRAEQLRQQQEMERKAAEQAAEQRRLEAERAKAVAEENPFAEAAALAKVEAVTAPIIPDTATTRRVMTRAATVWRWEITDPTAVPREFCCPDEKKIREHVNRNKEAAGIPGVRVWEDLDIRAR